MNNYQIRAALAVAEKGSFVQAAQVLFTSAPSIKNQIDSLERELTCELFIRTKRGCSLTPAGERFVQQADELLNHMQHFAQYVSTDKGGDVIRVLTLGDSPFVRRDMIIDAYQASRANVTVELYRGKQGLDVFDSILDGFADVGFIQSNNISLLNPGLHVVRCSGWMVDFRCIVDKNNPLASISGKLSLQGLAGQKVGFVSGTIPPAFNSLDIDRFIPFERDTVFNYCQSGGVCLCGDYFTTEFPQLKAIPLDVEPISMNIVIRKGAAPAVMHFAEFAANWTPAECMQENPGRQAD